MKKQKHYKKMTLKEFKEAFNEVYNFELWGYDGILNMIACMESREEDVYRQMGNEILADGSKRRHIKLYEILSERGYYER